MMPFYYELLIFFSKLFNRLVISSEQIKTLYLSKKLLEFFKTSFKLSLISGEQIKTLINSFELPI